MPDDRIALDFINQAASAVGQKLSSKDMAALEAAHAKDVGPYIETIHELERSSLERSRDRIIKFVG